VHAEAVESLLEQDVFAESGFSFEARASLGTGEHARRQGHRVTKREASIVRGFGQELLPEELLGLPEVGRLPAEGGAMHASEVREEVSVVAPEIRKELGVFVEPQKLTDDLDGEHFRVAERRGRSTGSETPELGDAIVDEAEDGHDEGAKIHERKSSFYSRRIGAPSRVRSSSVLLKSSKKPAHRVS